MTPEEAVDLRALTDALLTFREEREWGRFHTPRHLAAAISIECAELLEEFQWKSDKEIAQYLDSSEGRTAVAFEIADIVMYAVLTASCCGVDLGEAIAQKFAENGLKYPVAKAKGSSAKYTEL